MANGDVFRVTLKHAYTDAGIAVQHVLWFMQMSDDPVASESFILAEAVINEWTAGAYNETLKAVWSPQFQFLGVEVQKMLDPFEEPISASVPTVQSGGGDDVFGTPVAPVCALVQTLLSTRTGPRGRGRVYLGGFATRRPNIPGVTSEWATTTGHGHWSTNLTSQVQNHFNLFKATFDGVNVVDEDSGMAAVWGVWSRAIGGNTPPYNPAGFAAIIGHSSDGVIRVQRRREYGHGI